MKVRYRRYFLIALCDYNHEVAKKAGYVPRTGDYKPIFIACNIFTGELRKMYRVWGDAYQLDSKTPCALNYRIEASKVKPQHLPHFLSLKIRLDEAHGYDIWKFTFVSSEELLEFINTKTQ